MSLKVNNLRDISNKFRMTTFNKLKTILRRIRTSKLRIKSIFTKFDVISQYNIALKFS